MFLLSSNPRITHGKKEFFNPKTELARRALLQELQNRMKSCGNSTSDLKAYQIETIEREKDDSFRKRKRVKVTQNGVTTLFPSMAEASVLLGVSQPTLCQWGKNGHNPTKTIFVEVVKEEAIEILKGEKVVTVIRNGEKRIFGQVKEAAYFLRVNKDTASRWNRAGQSTDGTIKIFTTRGGEV